MKYLKLIFLCLCITFAACVQKNPAGDNTSSALNTDSLKTVLINTDKSWCDSCQKIGYFHSRAGFLADGALELAENDMPLDGKQAILDYAGNHADTLHLKWNPLRATVAASGDLGYTFGGWTLQTKTKSGRDTTMYGDYVTVWQKQADGSWKYIVDTGNDTPKQVEK